MGVAFLTNMLIVSDQTSEAVNVKYCNELHARSGLRFISPTNKRTEGRAPVWGSEFTSKDAALQGGTQQKPLLGSRKIARSDCCLVWCLVGSYLLVCASVLRSLPPAVENCVDTTAKLRPQASWHYEFQAQTNC